MFTRSVFVAAAWHAPFFSVSQNRRFPQRAVRRGGGNLASAKSLTQPL